MTFESYQTDLTLRGTALTPPKVRIVDHAKRLVGRICW
jgi:hypothetical protein